MMVRTRIGVSAKIGRWIASSESKLVPEYAGCIVVADNSGTHYQLYEYRGRRLFKPFRRFILSNGEAVKRIDFDHYELAKTGLKLKRLIG